MTRLTNTLATAAAAALIVTAGIASAQNGLKAEVPFAFHVGSKVMVLVTIHVRMLSGTNGGHAMIVNNYAAKRSYIVLPKQVGDAPKSWVASGQAKLGFDCSSGSLRAGKAGAARATPTTSTVPRPRAARPCSRKS